MAISGFNVSFLCLQNKSLEACDRSSALISRTAISCLPVSALLAKPDVKFRSVGKDSPSEVGRGLENEVCSARACDITDAST